MTLTEYEQQYLAGQNLARLATVAADGSPQNKPVGFRYNARLGTIDIHGMAMERSAKYRNVRVNPNVALVVDDVTAPGPEGVRFLEIRGTAETTTVAEPAMEHTSTQIIRIRPRRIVSWNLDPERPGLQTRDVT